MRDFSTNTRNALARNGITILRLTVIPDNSATPFASGERGYVVNDNGMSRIWTFSQVLEQAR